MHEQGMIYPQVNTNLANGFHERQTFDVAHGATNLNQNHVSLGSLGNLMNAPFDFVGDVGNDLNGATQIIATSLAGDHIGVYFAGGDISHLVQVDVDEPFVVAQIQVGFGSVFGNEDFAMLVGGHGSGIDVDVGVEFLHSDADATGFEQTPQRGRGHPFTH